MHWHGQNYETGQKDSILQTECFCMRLRRFIAAWAAPSGRSVRRALMTVPLAGRSIPYASDDYSYRFGKQLLCVQATFHDLEQGRAQRCPYCCWTNANMEAHAARRSYLIAPMQTPDIYMYGALCPPFLPPTLIKLPLPHHSQIETSSTLFPRTASVKIHSQPQPTTTCGK